MDAPRESETPRFCTNCKVLCTKCNARCKKCNLSCKKCNPWLAAKAGAAGGMGVVSGYHMVGGAVAAAADAASVVCGIRLPHTRRDGGVGEAAVVALLVGLLGGGQFVEDFQLAIGEL